jgi:hypothetical protein
MNTDYLKQAWCYLCNRLEFAVALSIVRQLVSKELDNGLYLSYSMMIGFLCTAALGTNVYKRSNTTIVLILQLLLADACAKALPIMDDATDDDIILIAHIAFYITMISIVLSLLCSIGRLVPSYSFFLHGISPYTILYAVGVCLPRLEQANQLRTSVLVMTCYSMTRIQQRCHAGQCSYSATWYIGSFLDYISDRVIMTGFFAGFTLMFGTYTLSLCATYAAVLILLSENWVSSHFTPL